MGSLKEVRFYCVGDSKWHDLQTPFSKELGHGKCMYTLN